MSVSSSKKGFLLLLSFVAIMGAFVPPCFADEEAAAVAATSPEAEEETIAGGEKLFSEEALAKASQNPITSVISLTLRNTTNFQASSEHNKTQNILTILPTVPIRLTDTWNIITRTTIPVLYQPALTPGTSREFGVSDINLTAYLTRTQSRKLIMGLGPTLFLPTAMQKTLGTGKWSAGPAFALLGAPGDWVLGFMVYNIWSFAGYDDRASVNQLLLQTFVNYNLPHGWYLCSAPFLAANWKQPNDDRWMVPAGGGVGKILRTGDLVFDLQAQGFYFVQRPRSESKWSLYLQLKFLFPKTWGGLKST
jgi:hypothetical protein